MSLYGFRPRFVPYVLDGSKTHTIRGPRKDGRIAKPGEILHLYTGLRTRNSRLLLRAPCIRVEEIRLDRARLWIDGVELEKDEKDMLAWRDGFRYDGTVMTICDPPVAPQVGCFELMLEFWVKTHGDTMFLGSIIHWDYAKRVMG